MPEQRQNSKAWLSAIPGRPIVCALILFAGINIALSAIKPNLQVKPTELPVRLSWEWWRTKSYLSEPKAPDVVVMGSSLMMIPTSLIDADFLNKNIDAVKHPHSVFLERKLQDAGAPKGISCFNFALPGAMISDQYFTAHSLFSGERAPKVILLGLTLRDFIDSGVDSATSTPTYQFFRHFDKTNDVKHLLTVTPQAAAEAFYNNINYLSDKRLELQTYFSKPINKVGNDALAGLPVSKFNAKDTEEKGDGNILGNAAVTEGNFILPPHKVIPWKDNTREYKKRFASANEKLFQNQVAFLDKLLADAKANGVKVVVANMPLTEKNMSLMPKGMYQKYMDEMNARAQRGDFSLIDLNSQWVFHDADFQDTAHLNATGGAKFMDLVAISLSKNEPVRRALAMYSQAGARTQTASSTEQAAF
ncbi:MAG TPA: DUF1574 domain-containing protein [Candidatus Melainabacteria bacterium]|jgi:hypothetical protein|nr:DUF1574 domain-containing protein [Candidatus Melainabacteria bacterium]